MDRLKPTTQMLGRFQPWHEGHTAPFERAISKTGQVVILLRDTEIDDNNPYSAVQRTELIKVELENEGYIYGDKYVIITVPNITHITYGRDVGYTIEQEHLEEEIENISATDIRKSL
jgi:nicotinamide mononucleotide adenylyltransferase